MRVEWVEARGRQQIDKHGCNWIVGEDGIRRRVLGHRHIAHFFAKFSAMFRAIDEGDKFRGDRNTSVLAHNQRIGYTPVDRGDALIADRNVAHTELKDQGCLP